MTLLHKTEKQDLENVNLETQNNTINKFMIILVINL